MQLLVLTHLLLSTWLLSPRILLLLLRLVPHSTIVVAMVVPVLHKRFLQISSSIHSRSKFWLKELTLTRQMILMRFLVAIVSNAKNRLHITVSQWWQQGRCCKRRYRSLISRLF
ncbi:hypothetical protein F5H01DRAFT_338392, partial [Linnemannia elongata]